MQIHLPPGFCFHLLHLSFISRILPGIPPGISGTALDKGQSGPYPVPPPASPGYKRLDREAEALLPTGVRCYPLYGKGERFPFSDPEAEPFFRGNLFGGRLYPALMEGEDGRELLPGEAQAGFQLPRPLLCQVVVSGLEGIGGIGDQLP